MRLNKLFLITILTSVALFAQSVGAEENLNTDSHLPFVPQADLSVTPLAPQLTADQRIPATEATTVAHDPNDLWHRIRSGFAMRELDSPLVARHEKWYASRPDYMARMTERSQRYLFYITEEVERRGMPAEIALLPMIESAFNPGANSIARASGLWQFIPSTGKNFGMQQNWWYDERRDIISATNGALDYLEKLHGQFGDWQLALAAYNWGEGAVSRAQMRNRKAGKPTDYSSLRLPRETQNYVPKLLAIKNLINDPARFGLSLASVPNKPYFVAVATARRMDVKLAAELAEISMEEFNALNPGHNRPVILDEVAGILLLPVDKLETFQNNLENTEQRLVSWQPYQSKKGEHFDKLAPRFGLSATQLRSVNGLSAHSKISNGQTLLVPIGDNIHTDNEFDAFNTHLTSIDETLVRTIKHTVRKGETLSTIARRYRVSQNRLLEWNNTARKLKVGQRLTIVQSVGRGPKMRLAKAGKSRSARNTRLARTNRNVRNTKTQKPTPSRRAIKIASSR